MKAIILRIEYAKRKEIEDAEAIIAKVEADRLAAVAAAAAEAAGEDGEGAGETEE